MTSRAKTPAVKSILDKALDGGEVSVPEAVTLFRAEGDDVASIAHVADTLRQRSVGDVVTYVVNRNINFTNVCIKQCGFCAFSRDYRQEQGYFLPEDEIVRRAQEAWDLGATEVCIQAGLPPHMDGDLYENLTRAIKRALPDIHIHGFSPEEVLYGAVRAKTTVRAFLARLMEAGVGSLPGTSAEILVQDVRDRIAPGRITVEQWINVVSSAHELGLPTTSTIMFGHIETDEHKATHLGILRDLQKKTGGFTEFVPLSFIHSEAPMFAHASVPGVRAGASRDEVIKMHAIARIMLDRWIPNLQASWVKEGLPMARDLLAAGVNDLGGTLMNESISTAAGAAHGQLVSPRTFRELIVEAGRVPAERATSYRHRRVFDTDEPLPGDDPLDHVGDDAEDRFGSYQRLVRADTFRFQHPKDAKA